MLVGAWLLFGVSPCLMATPMEPAGDHDCPHCETEIVVAPPACDVPADIVPLPGDPGWQILPAGQASIAPRPTHAPVRPPRFAVPHERPLLHRYCRLLE